MKHLRIFATALFAIGLLTAGCSKNPVTSDDPTGGGNPAAKPYSKDQLKPEGQVDTTATGYDVQGKLTVQSEQGDVPFENANMSIQFDIDGNLSGVSGTVSIPPPSNQVEFTNPVEAEVGYFSGTYINQNIDDFTLRVKEDRYYFVFYFAVAVEMKMGANNDPNAHKPFTIKAPIGGKTVMIIDYNDPMTYTYGEQDLLGASGTGDSEKGLIPYVPTVALDNFPDFDGHSVRVGAFDVFKVLGVQGQVIRSTRFDYDLLSDDIFGSMKAGEYAGINGAMDFTVGIKNILGFTVPMGEASGGASFEAQLSGVLGRVAVNGKVEPDNSWWPDFLGFTPAGQMTTKGHVLTTGDFSLAIAGGVSLLTPGSSTAAQGEIKVDNDALTLSASATSNGTTMKVSARVADGTTDYGVEIPPSMRFDGAAIKEQINKELAEADQALKDLEEASKNYEFELSLRGLRKDLPGIVDAAKKRIADEVASAKQKVRDAENWCSLNLSGIDNLVKPYYDVLNRLKNAANSTVDNATFRKEIEAALRDLASRDKINKSVSISGEVKRVGICWDYSTSRTVSVTVINSTQKAQLLKAADNVKYIAETSTIKIKAQQVFDAIQPQAILDKVRTDIDAGTAQIPSVDEVGIIHTHSPSTWEFYAVLSGERKVLGPYDPMNPAATADVISTLIIEMMSQ